MDRIWGVLGLGVARTDEHIEGRCVIPCTYTHCFPTVVVVSSYVNHSPGFLARPRISQVPSRRVSPGVPTPETPRNSQRVPPNIECPVRAFPARCPFCFVLACGFCWLFWVSLPFFALLRGFRFPEVLRVWGLPGLRVQCSVPGVYQRLRQPAGRGLFRSIGSRTQRLWLAAQAWDRMLLKFLGFDRGTGGVASRVHTLTREFYMWVF